MAAWLQRLPGLVEHRQRHVPDELSDYSDLEGTGRPDDLNHGGRQ